MSIRAHLIKNVEYGDAFFNLSHDRYFMQLLDEMGMLGTLNQDGAGDLEITKENLDDIYNEVMRNTKVDKKERGRALEIIEGIRKEMQKRGDDYLIFGCF